MKKLKYRKVGKAKPEPPLTTNKSGKVFITKAKKIDYLQNAMGAAILAAAQRGVRAEGAETQRDNAMIQLRQAVKNEERAKLAVTKLTRKRARDRYKLRTGQYTRQTVEASPRTYAQAFIAANSDLRGVLRHNWKLLLDLENTYYPTRGITAALAAMDKGLRLVRGWDKEGRPSYSWHELTKE